MKKQYTPAGVEIPEGYVPADDDDDFIHDPLAGTVDPETGLTYATDDDIRQTIKELSEEMIKEAEEAYNSIPPEERERQRLVFEEMDKCNDIDKKREIFEKNFPGEEWITELDELPLPFPVEE